MALFFYRLGLWAYRLALQLASPFVPKAKLWTQGRQNWRKKYAKQLAQLPKNKKRYWFHAASLGEFEQGRPLLEALRAQEPEALILLSFFSPSGYEKQKNYALADWVGYLPMDGPKNAQDFIALLAPEQAFFVRYEFWYFYLKILAEKNIPAYLVSANFWPALPFFKPWGGLFRKMLAQYQQIFVQDEYSKDLLASISCPAIVTGDTRLDRVLRIREEAKNYPLVQEFKGENKLWVLGSSWPADEKICLPFYLDHLQPKNWKLLIAPHEIGEERIQKLLNSLPKGSAIRYSSLSEKELSGQENILIIDNIGMLSSLYRYANMAYVGGGFGKGIHNTLEPAVYQIPLFFGPNHKKFVEATDLINLGLAQAIRSQEELATAFNGLNYKLLAQKAEQYIQAQAGASQKILDYLKQSTE
ncbi:3-deoxy-D-manno-octulosonic acid transferase [Saprospira grandis]|uniref:3-deoxy-D-manno-octulosonic acid transferase n=1 Tax=Saprospira grandis (strain Lewin) TaxID=984262 RepID=H6L8J3_SAPGL|nr:glycosyltransferase N-terminal domain-containing protein [Saprospira grandis]AFC26718.1 3-deoxy-D-manno-octulosonic-acid transferase domain protein [Saprospira grandis str. Lewin]